MANSGCTVVVGVAAERCAWVAIPQEMQHKHCRANTSKFNIDLQAVTKCYALCCRLLHSKYYTYTHHQPLLLSSKRYKMCLIHVAGAPVLALMRGVLVHNKLVMQSNDASDASKDETLCSSQALVPQLLTLQYSMHIQSTWRHDCSSK
jgi:hypothetical protein